MFSWKHPWSNAADTYLAHRLSERYLYVYPGRDYLEPNVRERLMELNRRAMAVILGIRRRPETVPASAEPTSAGQPAQKDQIKENL